LEHSYLNRDKENHLWIEKKINLANYCFPEKTVYQPDNPPRLIKDMFNNSGCTIEWLPFNPYTIEYCDLLHFDHPKIKIIL
jgi:hypothetical protein